MRSLTVLAATLTLVSVGSAQSFVKAQFIFFRDGEGKSYNPPRQFSMTKAADLAKISKFLPGLGLPKGGLKPSGWTGWGTIRLLRTKGPGLAVFFSSDGKVYSMIGKTGDFPAGK